MANQALPNPEMLHKLLEYDPETGELAWRERSPSLFVAGHRAAEWQAKIWNAQFSGKPALSCMDGCGYRSGHLFRVSAKAHRVVWAMMTGQWPNEKIDHINGIRSDNRWVNLRQVSNSMNLRNAKMRNDNASGHNGIGWHKASGKWRARITLVNQQVHLGTFSKIEDAIAARSAAEIGHGFTDRHGKV